MMDKGASTRERIVATAERLVLQKGFAATSLDDVLRETKLTKGAFFHHFKGKAELGRAIAEHYASNDTAMFAEWAQRADRLSDDPLERVMIFLKLFEEFLEKLEQPPRGCIFASYLYENGVFPPETLDFVRARMDDWRAIYEQKFAALIAAYPPAAPVTAKDLSETITAIIQGSFVMGNAYRDRSFMARQSRLFRQHLGLLFRRP